MTRAHALAHLCMIIELLRRTLYSFSYSQILKAKSLLLSQSFEVVITTKMSTRGTHNQRYCITMYSWYCTPSQNWYLILRLTGHDHEENKNIYHWKILHAWRWLISFLWVINLYLSPFWIRKLLSKWLNFETKFNSQSGNHKGIKHSNTSIHPNFECTWYVLLMGSKIKVLNLISHKITFTLNL